MVKDHLCLLLNSFTNIIKFEYLNGCSPFVPHWTLLKFLFWYSFYCYSLLYLAGLGIVGCKSVNRLRLIVDFRCCPIECQILIDFFGLIPAEIETVNFLRWINLVFGTIVTWRTLIIWNWLGTLFLCGLVSLVNAFNPSFEACLGRLLACF
jgi:hypothetical protein